MFTMYAVLFLCLGFSLTCLGKWVAVEASNPSAASTTHVAMRRGSDGRMRPYRSATVREAYHYENPTKMWIDVENANMYFFVIGTFAIGALVGALWAPSYSLPWYIGLAASVIGSGLALLSLVQYPDGRVRVPFLDKLYHPLLMIIPSLMILVVVQAIFWPKSLQTVELIVFLALAFLLPLLLLLDWVLPGIIVGSANKKAQQLLYSMVGNDKWDMELVDDAAGNVGGYYSLLDFIKQMAKRGEINDNNFLDKLRDLASMR